MGQKLDGGNSPLSQADFEQGAPTARCASFITDQCEASRFDVSHADAGVRQNKSRAAASAAHT